MSDNHGAVWWSELMTRDFEKAKDYYARLCGWQFEAMPVDWANYAVASHRGKPVAGIMDMSGSEEMKDLPSHWFTYLAVDDVDAAAAETEKAGGRIVRAPFDVQGVGRIVIVQDPGGAAVGIMTPAETPVAAA